MKTQSMKPNPETPNRKILRLAREIIRLWAAQGKEFTVDDVLRTLFDNKIPTEFPANLRGDQLAILFDDFYPLWFALSLLLEPCKRPGLGHPNEAHLFAEKGGARSCVWILRFLYAARVRIGSR